MLKKFQQDSQFINSSEMTGSLKNIFNLYLLDARNGAFWLAPSCYKTIFNQ